MPALLSRPEFVARYVREYASEYEPPKGIRMVRGARGGMHVQMSSKGSVQSQLTKRNRRIDEAYAEYCAAHAAMKPATATA